MHAFKNIFPEKFHFGQQMAYNERQKEEYPTDQSLICFAYKYNHKSHSKNKTKYMWRGSTVVVLLTCGEIVTHSREHLYELIKTKR